MEDSGPLPPHERTWRHPSELGPPAHEPTSGGGRVLIASTATLGLLLVGVLALTMTPRRSGSPATVGSTLADPAGSVLLRSAAAADALPLVTPVGGDGLAVTTADALEGAGARFVRVRLSSGEVVEVEVLGADSSGELTVVSLPAGTDTPALQVARREPRPTDTVLVQTDDPVVITMTELAHVDAAEATPILDARGRLVGLCTGEEDRRSMISVSAAPADPTATTTTTTPATTTTAAPTTTRPPATTQPTAPPTPTTAQPTTPPTPSTTTPPTAPSSPAPTTAPPEPVPSSPELSGGHGDRDANDGPG